MKKAKMEKNRTVKNNIYPSQLFLNKSPPRALLVTESCNYATN